MYKPGMGELPILLYQLDQLILEHASELHNHFKAHEFSTATFASKWFLTLFCSVFPKVNFLKTNSIFQKFFSLINVLKKIHLGPRCSYIGYFFRRWNQSDIPVWLSPTFNPKRPIFGP